jgi:hypothetical protein
LMPLSASQPYKKAVERGQPRMMGFSANALLPGSINKTAAKTTNIILKYLAFMSIPPLVKVNGVCV